VLAPISNPDGDGAYLVDWNDVPRATSYKLQQSSNPSFAPATAVYNGPNSQFSVTGQQGGTWYYRVLAANDKGEGPWSNTQSVVVKPGAPNLAAIENPGGGDEYLLSWSAVAGATGYTLQEAGNASFSSAQTRYSGAARQYRVTGQPGGTWYYRVRTESPWGESAWSQTRSTTVAAAALPAPALSPISNGDRDGNYVVNWAAVSGANSYRLEQSPDSYFSNPVEVFAGTATSFSVTDQPGGTWHYRVRALGPAGRSPWSAPRSTTVLVRAFLSLVAKNHGEPRPSGGIVNGDFEKGRTGWTEYSSNQYVLILNAGFPSYFAPHSGSWVAWLGGVRDLAEDSYIEQGVTVPASQPYLAYWRWIDSEELLCGFDMGSVSVNGAPVDSFSLCALNNTGGWVKRVLDLRSYAGQAVSLRFRAQTDGSLISNLFIDDVSFQATALSTTTEAPQEPIPGSGQGKPRAAEPPTP
jgi:hypothetical protein